MTEILRRRCDRNWNMHEELDAAKEAYDLHFKNVFDAMLRGVIDGPNLHLSHTKIGAQPNVRLVNGGGTLVGGGMCQPILLLCRAWINKQCHTS